MGSLLKAQIKGPCDYPKMFVVGRGCDANGASRTLREPSQRQRLGPLYLGIVQKRIRILVSV